MFGAVLFILCAGCAQPCLSYPSAQPMSLTTDNRNSTPTGNVTFLRKNEQQAGIPTITLFPQASGSAAPSVNLGGTDRKYTEVSSSLIFAANGQAASDIQKDLVVKCDNTLDAACVKALSVPLKTPSLTLQGRAIGTAILVASFVFLLIATMLSNKNTHPPKDIFAGMDTSNAQSIDDVKMSSTVDFLTKSGDPPFRMTFSNDGIVATTADPPKPTEISMTQTKEGVKMEWPPELSDVLADSSFHPPAPSDDSIESKASYADQWAANIARSKEVQRGGKYSKVYGYVEAWVDRFDSWTKSQFLTWGLYFYFLQEWTGFFKEITSQGFMTRERKLQYGLHIAGRVLLIVLNHDWTSDESVLRAILIRNGITVPARGLDAPKPDLPPQVKWGEAKLDSVPKDHNGDFSVRLDLAFDGSDTTGKLTWSLFLGLNGQGDVLAKGDSTPDHNNIPVDRGRLYVFYAPDTQKGFGLTDLYFLDWRGLPQKFQVVPSQDKDLAHPSKFTCDYITPPSGAAKSMFCKLPLNPRADDGKYRLRFIQTAVTTPSRKVTLYMELYTNVFNELISTANIPYTDNKNHQADLIGFQDLPVPKGEWTVNKPWYRFTYPMTQDKNGRIRITIKEGLAADGGLITVAHGYTIWIAGAAKWDTYVVQCDKQAAGFFYDCGAGCKERTFDCVMPDKW